MPNLPPDAYATRVRGLCQLYLRAPDSIATDNATGQPILVFTPALTGPEQTTLTRILNLAKSLVEGITADEWAAIEPDIAGLITFAGIATPTLAQTVLAVKAQSRILKAIIRN
jgi:hypothetical protein